MQRDHDLLKKDNNNNIEDSNNNNDNIIKALNNHSDNSICLLVGWMIWYKFGLDFIDQIRQNIIIWEINKTITYKLKFIDSFRFMPDSLSNLVDKTSGIFNSIECKSCIEKRKLTQNVVLLD